MVARINTGSSPGGAVRYNEIKVTNGEARVIAIDNFPSNHPEELSIRDKISILEDLTERNSKVTDSTMHISLAFHPSETEILTDDKIGEIASEYMEKLGYGNQPILIYRHEDTQHPHVHIVTVSIDNEGKKISDSLIKVRSNDIRKEIEVKHDLIKAEEQAKDLSIGIRPEQAIEYGKAETKKAIGTVIQTAFKDYSFSNLSEFDQFIKSYGVQMNVIESKGRSNHKGETDWKGLTFQITDGDKPVSPEVKGSEYHFKPNYKKLQASFHNGAKKKNLHKAHLLANIKESLTVFEKVSEADFKNALRERSIQVIDTGKNYLYVDHKKRTVFSESDLGKQFSRANITANFEDRSILREKKPQKPAEPELSPVDRAALGKLVSKHFQQFKKDNDITFESQLIQRFPYQQMIDALKAEGKTDQQASMAVSEFERYKQSQLADILSKEQAYFDKTAIAYLSLAKQMPITAESRVDFLRQVQLTLTQKGEEGFALAHSKNASLTLPLSQKDHQELMKGTALSVPFIKPLPPAERRVYLAAATGNPLKPEPFSALRMGTIKKALPAVIFERVSTELNASQIKSYEAAKQPTADKLTQFYFDRGMVVTQQQGQFRAGFHQTPPNSFQPITGEWLRQLQTQGLPKDYQQQVAKLSTEAGRMLIQYSQALDNGDTYRRSMVEDKVRKLDTPLNQTGEALISALRIRVEEQPMTRPERPSIPTAVTAQRDPAMEAMDKLLYRDYGRFRQANGYYYESTLLKKPEQFPVTRLTSFLTQEPHSIDSAKAIEAVSSFKAYRLSQLSKVQQKDDEKFATACKGYVSMVGQAPLSSKDKLGILGALYLRVEKAAEGEYRLLYKSDPSFAYSLSKGEMAALKLTPEKPQRVSVPEKEFPRYERQLYETLALGGKLTHNPEEKMPITFLNFNGERAKTILTPQQWEGVGQWLNQNTVGVALPVAPIDGADKLRWLYQRGLVVEPTAKGYQIGHHLTESKQYIPVAASLVAVIDASKKQLPDADTQRKALQSERGRIMIELAGAIDSRSDTHINRVVDRIVYQMPELAPLSARPTQLLDKLSTTYGPYREPVPIIQSETELSTDGPQEDKSDNLSELGRAMDTSKMKKKRGTDPIRALRIRR